MKVSPGRGRLKVLHVSATSTGGVGHNLLMLARYLDRSRFELSFAIPDDSSFYERIVNEGATVYRINIDRRPNALKNMRACYELAHIMSVGKNDIVHTHTSVGGFFGRILARCTRTPVVIWTIHGWAFDYPSNSPLQRRLFQTIERVLDGFTDRYIAISGNIKQVGVTAGIAPADAIEVIYHGIEVDHFTSGDKSAGERRYIPDLSPVVGTIGRLDRQKAIDDLLKAAALLKSRYADLRVIIVGDGPLRGALENLSSRLGIQDNVIFAGWQSKVERYLECMDVFCLPSHWEGFGIVLLEAMAAGKAIVGTRVGGIPEVVEHGCGGMLVPVGRPSELAGSLVVLLTDYEMREKMGDYNRTRVSTLFRVQEMIKKYETFYERVAQSG